MAGEVFLSKAAGAFWYHLVEIVKKATAASVSPTLPRNCSCSKSGAKTANAETVSQSLLGSS